MRLGNAPTALIHLYEQVEKGIVDPELIIGVPVGFVNVVQSKGVNLKIRRYAFILLPEEEKVEVILQHVFVMHLFIC